MKKSEIEIPFNEDKNKVYRFFEILPGALSYLVFLIPFILSFINPVLAAYFLVSYVLIWFTKAIAMSYRVLQGYGRVKRARRIDWRVMLKDLENPLKSLKKYEKNLLKVDTAHIANLEHVAKRKGDSLKVDEIFHAVIIATYNESSEIIEPTIQNIIKSNAVNTRKNMVFIIAYEARAGHEKQIETEKLIRKYSEHFYYSFSIKHDVGDDEINGKGGNATCAGRRLQEWVESEKIEPARVLVTVLDADNRPDANYFAILQYSYFVADKRKKHSYQPIAMYTNNIWDVPSIMRLSAVNNSFFHTGNAMRMHALRNFSAHSQSLDALIDSNYWSTRTIVEDGHQFWRMYFTYDGDHDVLPIYAPIYQDAVLASSYKKTMIAQFKQIRRWTYGASDVAYVATKAFFTPNKVSKFDATLKFFRLLENHVTWASSSLLLVVAGWVPLLISSNPDDSIVSLQLPSVMAKVNIISLVVILTSMYIGVASLPPKPKRYRHTRWFSFILQWLLIPIVGVIFNSLAAYYSQTRLMLGRYFGDFDVTEKAIKQ